MNWTLHVISADGTLFRVGEANRDYVACLNDSKPITSAMHDGRLPGLRGVIIQQDAAGPLYRGLLPGDVFPSGVAAVAACAAHVDVQRPDGPAEAAAWFLLAERLLVRCGVLEELDDDALRLRKVPVRNDLPLLVVDEVWEALKGIGSTSLR